MALPFFARFISRHIAPSLADFVKTFQLREQVRRERKALAALDERLLHDIGVSREDARREVARPSWDLPASRRPIDHGQPATPTPAALCMSRSG